MAKKSRRKSFKMGKKKSWKVSPHLQRVAIDERFGEDGSMITSDAAGAL